jgi:hypothetical protein
MYNQTSAERRLRTDFHWTHRVYFGDDALSKTQLYEMIYCIQGQMWHSEQSPPWLQILFNHVNINKVKNLILYNSCVSVWEFLQVNNSISIYKIIHEHLCFEKVITRRVPKSWVKYEPFSRILCTLETPRVNRVIFSFILPAVYYSIFQVAIF